MNTKKKNVLESKQYSLTIDVKLLELLLPTKVNLERNALSKFTKVEAYVDLVRRQITSMQSTGDATVNCPILSLSSDWGWYHVKVKDFLHELVQSGDIVVSQYGKRTLITLENIYRIYDNS